MENLINQLLRSLGDGQRIVFAHIIRQIGSAPRPAGATCLILEDGTLIGSVGGGALEYKVLQRAKDVLRQGQTALMQFELTGETVEGVDMLCGGRVEVYLEPLSPEDNDAVHLFRKASQIIETGRTGVLVTRVAEGMRSTDPDCRAIIYDDLMIEGSCAPVRALPEQERAGLLLTAHPKLVTINPKALQLFVQPLRPDAVLYIFGAGHISTYIAPIAKSVGFRIVIIDDRGEFANKVRFPSADEIIVAPFTKAFERIRVTSEAYLAIVTRGHFHDQTVLAQALEKEWAYVGMVGSRRKREILYQSLIAKGIDESRLNQVSCPIGLPIDAVTPEEIAVSIVAEIISVRAKIKNSS